MENNDLIKIDNLSSFALSQLNENPMGLRTGLAELDNKIRGLKGSEFIVIAGRPSMGKTSLAVDIALNIGMTHKVIFFSVEMNPTMIAQRMLGNLANVNIHKLQLNQMLPDAWDKLKTATKKLEVRNIWFDGSAMLSPYEIANKLAQVDDFDCVIIDYIQLMGIGYTQGNRTEEVSAISRHLKALARDTNKPFVVLSQLNRQAEYRANKRPMLSDLRESGSLEQDADIVLLLFREGYYSKGPEDGSAEIIIAKNRNGPTGIVNCFFNLELTRFENFNVRDDF